MYCEFKSEWLRRSYLVKIVTEVWTFFYCLRLKLIMLRKQIWPLEPYGSLI
jgi:hypothetical protein